MEKWMVIVRIVIAVCIFFGILLLQVRWNPAVRVLDAYDNICMLLRNRSGPLWSYDRWADFLRRNGAAFHLGKWINPFSFFLLSGLLGLSGCLLGSYLDAAFVVILGTAGLLLPGLYIEYAN